jgi:UDP-2,4-diacetamido-2,4,6-trideoxy-beta-L-altropyranose hydrolase
VLDENGGESQSIYESWLGVDWATDAEQSKVGAGETTVDCLIVDHYALDAQWERTLRPFCRKLMVIDDLANRQHDCDLLLDQNLGREAADYSQLVPEGCKVLVGPNYALLRPEFFSQRKDSLFRRTTNPQLKHLLISMGGVDQADATGKVLEALKECSLPADLRITVVMGKHAPWLDRVKLLARQVTQPIEVKVNVSNMAQLMAESDLAIGAAGGTSWERCCLGLPAIVVVLADNQRDGAHALEQRSCVKLIDQLADLPHVLCEMLGDTASPHVLSQLSQSSSNITDGNGAARVREVMVFDMADHAIDHNRLRSMTAADLPSVLALRNHAEVRRYMLTQHEISTEEHRSWFDRASQNTKVDLLVWEMDDRCCGFVQFKETNYPGVVDWGFYVAPDAPRGTGTKLGLAALAHAFKKDGLYKICGHALRWNLPSIEFHKSLGFTQEGILRDQYFDGDKHHDMIFFGLLKQEWAGIESEGAKQ